MKHIILIGGHDAQFTSYKIEDYIVSLYNSPKILFFPTAMKDSLKAIDNFKLLFKKYNIDIDIAYLYNNKDSKEIILDKISKSDILYFGGGNTEVLVSKIKEYDLIDILKETDKTLVGISAGAIMLSKCGMGDRYSYPDNFHTYNYKMVEGAGILNISICPHYQNEDLYLYNDEVKKLDFDSYAVENECAIDFYDGKIKVIKANLKNSVYKFSKEEGYIMTPLYEKKQMAVLGPAGTFCDMAFNKFNKDDKYEAVYYPSIKKTIEAIDEIGLAILPFENSLDGYVVESVDKLIKLNYNIIADVTQKVSFAFVSNASDILDIKEVYVQFKAKAECIDFLSKYNFKTITTETNMESFNRLVCSDKTFGAIIPLKVAEETNFNINIKNVDDKDNNITRFVIVSKNKDYFILDDLKYSISVLRRQGDKPGLLYDILKKFNDYKVNLTTILSRPTKEDLGSYNFYIEVSAKKEDIDNINECIKALTSDDYIVKVLGIYSMKE